MIHFIRYVRSKLIKILCLHYNELIGKIEEHKITFNGWWFMRDKALDKIKKIIGIEKVWLT